MNSYDLVVIGSGPGGQRAAVQAAKLGKSVLVIEKNRIGGACLHQGTIPSKTLREAALNSSETGEKAFLNAMRRSREVITAEQAIIENQLTRNKIEILQGTARFKNLREVEVLADDQTLPIFGKNYIIATGTRPHTPKEVPFNTSTLVNSDTILNLRRFPIKMAVVGAGVIGCEYASIFAKLGSLVTLFEQRKTLLRSVDGAILKRLEEQFQMNGIEIRSGVKLMGYKSDPNKAIVAFDNQELEFDVVLYCLGRCGNIEELQLENAGVKVSNRGLIEVNKSYQTNIENIFAVGDVQGAPGLATSASEQGRMAAAAIFADFKGLFPETFPYGIYTIPEISQVGPTEEELQKENRPYVVGISRYKELARGKILKDDEGILKLIFDSQTEKLLAVHILGTGATELVHIGQTAIALGAKLDFFVSNVFNYPTLAEAYKVASYMAFNTLSKTKK
jgi:NAD(P) transhydrogenase